MNSHIIIIMAIGIIGGSGFYEWFEGATEKKETPFGFSSPITMVDREGVPAYFLARHGPEHGLPPHLVNYRANIYALREVSVTHIIATNAVGSCKQAIKPGDFMVPNQLIDLTTGRRSTFFEGSRQKDVPEEFRKVKHTDVSFPYKGDVRDVIIEVLSDGDIDFHYNGTYVTTNGPRFETAAEIQMAKLFGGDIVGMTSAPEAFLARELEIDYATVCLITNYAAGMQDTISHQEVIKLFDSRTDDLKRIIKRCLSRLDEKI